MFKNIDIGAAMNRLADRKIEQAMEEGKFDNLEGAGKPLDLEPMPADENARLLWWAIRLLRKNDFVPDEVRYRKSIAMFQQHLPRAKDEADVRSTVAQANDLIVKLNTMGTNAISNTLAPLDAEAEVARWRERHQGDS